MSPILFLSIALATVWSALGVVRRPNPVHAALSLVTTLFLVAVLFLSLQAELIAMLQVVVYAGAIVVLFLFVIMLLNLQVEQRSLSAPPLVGVAVAGGLAVAALLTGAFSSVKLTAPDVPAGFGHTEMLAPHLFTTYLVPFELTSFLLLVAIIGAVAIAKKRM